MQWNYKSYKIMKLILIGVIHTKELLEPAPHLQFIIWSGDIFMVLLCIINIIIIIIIIVLWCALQYGFRMTGS